MLSLDVAGHSSAPVVRARARRQTGREQQELTPEEICISRGPKTQGAEHLSMAGISMLPAACCLQLLMLTQKWSLLGRRALAITSSPRAPRETPSGAPGGRFEETHGEKESGGSGAAEDCQETF